MSAISGTASILLALSSIFAVATNASFWLIERYNSDDNDGDSSHFIPRVYNLARGYKAMKALNDLKSKEISRAESSDGIVELPRLRRLMLASLLLSIVGMILIIIAMLVKVGGGRKRVTAMIAGVLALLSCLLHFLAMCTGSDFLRRWEDISSEIKLPAPWKHLEFGEGPFIAAVTVVLSLIGGLASLVTGCAGTMD